MGRKGPKATPPLAAFRAGTEDGTLIAFQRMAHGLLPEFWLSGLGQEHGACSTSLALQRSCFAIWNWARHLTGTQLGKTTQALVPSLS